MAGRQLLALILFTALLSTSYLPSLGDWAPNTAQASASNGTLATMAEYWNGEAEWVFLRKDTAASTGIVSYFDGTQVKMMNDGTWYLFNRKWGTAAGCPGGAGLDTQVRKSTDKGQTWSAPVMVLEHTPGTAYECAATDGDVWYNAAEDKWHYLFQCISATSPWGGCLLSRSGSDPMGPFTIAPSGGNPVVSPGEMWNQICDVSTDHCSILAGGVRRVFDEGTFNIFNYDGTYYWVAFHGYDGVRGYRGIAKTADFQNWIAGDPSQGVPADAVSDVYDSAGWRESWQSGGTIGAGAGNMFMEGGYYYHLVESSDLNLGCTPNQNWNYGLYRSTSLTNTTWDQFPGGNPIIYSSHAVEGTSIPLCNIQYASIVQDPTDNAIYMIYGRRSADPEYDGIYWYRLEKSSNLLENANFWRADTHFWNRLGTGTNWHAKRLPNLSVDGTPFLATNCGGTCSPTNSIFQDVSIAGGTSGQLHFGGKYRSVGTTGSLELVIRQMDNSHTILQTDIVPVTTLSSWSAVADTVPLLAATRIIRYEFYLRSSNTEFYADDLYLHISTHDTLPPRAVTDLAVTSANTNSATLAWTAPGNDGTMGKAASYDIRYSTAPITAANWATATQATGEPAPAAPGNKQSFTVSGLSSATDYYFAIRTSDGVPLVSGLSNIATATTSSGSSLFQDNFNNNQIGPSWHTFGGTWSETGNVLRQTSAADGDPKKALIRYNKVAFPANPVTITAKVRVDSWTDGDYARAGVSLFNSTVDGGGYNLLFHNNHSTVQFLDDNVAWGPSFSFSWTNGTWYWFKLKMDGGTLYGKVWQDGTAEPATWPYSWSRSGRSGFPGLNGGSAKAGSGNVTVSFDDVTVS